jgi:hypothetical protein
MNGNFTSTSSCFQACVLRVCVCVCEWFTQLSARFLRSTPTSRWTDNPRFRDNQKGYGVSAKISKINTTAVNECAQQLIKHTPHE